MHGKNPHTISLPVHTEDHHLIKFDESKQLETVVSKILIPNKHIFSNLTKPILRYAIYLNINLKTVNKKKYNTFREACFASGFHNDDNE